MSVNTFGVPGTPPADVIYKDREVVLERLPNGNFLVCKNGMYRKVSLDVFEALAFICDESVAWTESLGLDDRT